MDTDYSRPRQRARTFGAGVLSGAAISQDGAMNKVQENLQFRLQSLRGLIVGQGGEGGFNPIERRQAIRNRRQELLQRMTGGSASDTTGSVTTADVGGGAGSSSGQIGDAKASHSEASPSTNRVQTPSMSEVDKGTKARAMDRGYRD